MALKASEVAGFCRRAGRRGRRAVADGSSSGWGTGPQQKFLATLAADLKANGGKCVVIPGEQQPAQVHLAAIAINQALGNVGKTVVYTETVNPDAVDPG